MSAKYGVTCLGVFGSVARNEATDVSDVDIIVEMPPDLFRMAHMKQQFPVQRENAKIFVKK